MAEDYNGTMVFWPAIFSPHVLHEKLGVWFGIHFWYMLWIALNEALHCPMQAAPNQESFSSQNFWSSILFFCR